MKPIPAAALCFVITGCLHPQSHTEAGVQPVEAEIMTRQYYWQKDRDSKQYSDAQIHTLFARSKEIDPMDGEKAELQASMLRYALAAAGDLRYAKLLADEPVELQQAVAEFIGRPLSFGGLHYPQTDTLLLQLPAKPSASPQ